jgi:hypothetical protein
MSFNYLAENGAQTRRADANLHRERSKIYRGDYTTVVKNSTVPKAVPKSKIPSQLTYPFPKQIHTVNPQLTTEPPRSVPQARVCPCQQRKQ